MSPDQKPEVFSTVMSMLQQLTRSSTLTIYGQLPVTNLPPPRATWLPGTVP